MFNIPEFYLQRAGASPFTLMTTKNIFRIFSQAIFMYSCPASFCGVCIYFIFLIWQQDRRFSDFVKGFKNRFSLCASLVFHESQPRFKADISSVLIMPGHRTELENTAMFPPKQIPKCPGSEARQAKLAGETCRLRSHPIALGLAQRLRCKKPWPRVSRMSILSLAQN